MKKQGKPVSYLVEKPPVGKTVIVCRLCGTIMGSWSVHDFKMCKDQVMIDGGNDYLRYGGNKSDYYLMRLEPWGRKET